MLLFVFIYFVYITGHSDKEEESGDERSGKKRRHDSRSPRRDSPRHDSRERDYRGDRYGRLVYKTAKDKNSCVTAII